MAVVGTILTFENERVRIWELTLQPGESVVEHRRDLDYFFYPIEGNTLEVTRVSGVTRLTLNAGEVHFRKAATPMRRAMSTTIAIMKYWSS